jgi:hypothetical protein
MASEKRKRKAAKKPKPAGQPFRHPDGDRRRRDEYRQAVRDFRARLKFTAGIPEDLPPVKPVPPEPA